ncbi:MAG: hypothetical protein RLZZ210_346, partial [Pseudomonadota bacterium]
LDIPDDKILEQNKNIFLHLHHMLDSSDVMDDFEEAVRVNKILLEGERKERAEGEAIGIQKGKFEIAKSMKKEGLDINLIIRLTGLTHEDIENL